MYRFSRNLFASSFVVLTLLIQTGCMGPSLMVKHAQEGNVTGLKAELSKGVDVNADQGIYNTLSAAAQAGKLASVKFLIENGATIHKYDINELHSWFKSPMYTATLNAFPLNGFHRMTIDHFKVIEYLIKQGVDVNFVLIPGGDSVRGGDTLLDTIVSFTCDLGVRKNGINHLLKATELLMKNGATVSTNSGAYGILNGSQPCVNNDQYVSRVVNYVRDQPRILAEKKAKAKHTHIAKTRKKERLSAMQKLAKQQACKLNSRDWVYIDKQCKNKKAHGTGRAVYKDGIHFFKGKIYNGKLISGEYLENGKPIFDGKFTNNRPNGKGVCFYKGEPEECKYYKGKRIDTLYKQRKENLEHQRKQNAELAKLRGEIQKLKNQPMASPSQAGGNSFGDVLLDKAAEQGMKKIFDSLF